MRTIKKIIKKTIGVLFLVLLIIGGVIGYKGYERYKEVLEKVPLQEKIAEIPGNHLVYGPVEIPETDSIICGFLAADGPDLEDLWYGIWYEMDGRIEKYVLFP